ncbi:MAG: peptidoglycan-binding protein [Deltaproteobacteria bacterium]|nr:peptidoglycan-binding protein [Deltaproteobacteria bacterium]
MLKGREDTYRPAIQPGAEQAQAPFQGPYTKYPGYGPMMLGQKGKELKEMQLRLQKEGVDIKPDPNKTGYFGDNMRDAVLAYQDKVGLQKSGIIDEATANALRGQPPRTHAPPAPGSKPPSATDRSVHWSYEPASSPIAKARIGENQSLTAADLRSLPVGHSLQRARNDGDATEIWKVTRTANDNYSVEAFQRPTPRAASYFPRSSDPSANDKYPTFSLAGSPRWSFNASAEDVLRRIENRVRY